MSRTGKVLDPTGGILISAGGFARHHSDVAYNGTDYLAVWGDERNGGWSFIYGARLDTSGSVLDTQGIYIAGQTGWGFLWYPAIASDGENWFAVWLDGRSTSRYSIYGARIDPSGTVLDPAGISISIDATTDEYASSVAFDGMNYLVVWGDQNLYGSNYCSDIYCARVTPDGSVLDPAGIPIAIGSYNQWQPSVAFDGTNYLVVWQDLRGSGYIIRGARVTPAGTVLDPGGFGIAHSGVSKRYPSVAFDGNNYLVVWQDGRNGVSYDIYGVQVSPSGSIQGPEFPISTGNGHTMSFDPEPAITFDGTDYMVAWMDTRTWESTGQDIRSARVTPQCIVMDTIPIIVSSITYSQFEPSGAFDGTNYLIAWRDNRHGNSIYVTGQWSIYGARVNSTGTVLDTESIAILPQQVTTYGPSLAFDGTNHFCVWHDLRNWPGNHYDIYGARVAQSGVVLDTTGIPIATAGYWERYPSLAFDGTNYLCVWHNEGYDEIVGARIDPSGNILGTLSISGSTATDNPYPPPVVFDEAHYFVVWEDNRNGGIDIYSARVDTTGTLMDTSGIPISTAIDEQRNPSVTFDGTNYFVVWEDKRNGDADIYGARVDTACILLDTSGIEISTAINSQQNPSVIFDGTDYCVVWEDKRSGDADIYGAKVTPSGGLIDSFAVSIQPGNQIDPKLILGPGNQILVVYSGFIDSINGRPVNTMRIWGKYYPFVGIKEETNFVLQNPKSAILNVYPNPFSKKTDIRYQVSDIQMQDVRNKTQDISLKIYDVSGRIVKVFNLTSGILLPASTVSWDGTDDSGNPVQSGVYFCRFVAGDYQATKKLLFLQ